jgi:hypothetical protein
MRIVGSLCVVCVLSLGGCEEDEAPFDYARTVCERRAECGVPSVMCQGTPPNYTCVGTLVSEDYDPCYAAETNLFDGLTAAQQEEWSVCARWCARQECVSQALVEALASSFEGQPVSGFPDLDPPPECLAAPEPWFPPCGMYLP